MALTKGSFAGRRNQWLAGQRSLTDGSGAGDPMGDDQLPGNPRDDTGSEADVKIHGGSSGGVPPELTTGGGALGRTGG